MVQKARIPVPKSPPGQKIGSTNYQVGFQTGLRDTAVKTLVRNQTQNGNSVRQASDERRGAATLETAVSIPLLIILVFGSIEMANAVFLKQTVNLAAYEAAKLITRPGSNQALAETRVAEIMTARRVTTYTLSFSPTVNTATPRGTQVTVTLSAPASNLSYGPLRFMTGKTVTATVNMVRL